MSVPPNDRLDFLENLLATGKADSFARYALALEYEKLDRAGDAIAVFEALRRSDPEYLPMFLMAGRLLSQTGQVARAVEWLEAGALLAKSRSDGKTESELTELLATL